MFIYFFIDCFRFFPPAPASAGPLPKVPPSSLWPVVNWTTDIKWCYVFSVFFCWFTSVEGTSEEFSEQKNKLIYHLHLLSREPDWIRGFNSMRCCNMIIRRWMSSTITTVDKLDISPVGPSTIDCPTKPKNPRKLQHTPRAQHFRQSPIANYESGIPLIVCW